MNEKIRKVKEKKTVFGVKTANSCLFKSLLNLECKTQVFHRLEFLQKASAIRERL